MSGTSNRVSLNAFSKLVGCDARQARRWVSSGRLARGEDGLLDAGVAPAWRAMFLADKPAGRKGSVKPPRTPAGVSPPDTTPEQLAAQALLAGTDLPFEESRRLREFYSMQLLKIDYDTRVGEVALIADISAMLGEQCSRVRSRLLALPATLAARVAGMTSAAQVDAALSEAVWTALAELTCDAPPP